MKFRVKVAATLCLSLAAVIATIVSLSASRASADFRPMGLNFDAPTVNGTANVTSPALGEIVYDTLAGVFSGYNGTTWVTLSSPAGAFVPTGTILPFTGTTVPTGYLLCDGSSVSQATYAALYAVVGNAYGASGGNFNVPDLRARFLRGSDNMGTGAASRDPDAAGRTAMNTGGNTGNNVGSIQVAQLASHGHNVQAESSGVTTSLLGASGFGGITHSGTQSYVTNTAAGTIEPFVQATGGNETRPINAYVNYIIKI
jgi:microcystin-dependent protein